MKHNIHWVQRGGPPTVKPNPDYPNGMTLDVSGGAKQACQISLPYPTKKLRGLYVIECTECGVTTGVTTAGRPDDPHTVILPCGKPGETNG